MSNSRPQLGVLTELLYVLSDIEMGRGDITDDFYDDDLLVRFIDEKTALSPQVPKTLILNGDTFDFLKMAYRGEYPRYISEEMSLWKMDEVIEAHHEVFEAMRRFLSSPNNVIFFVIGNHDQDLAWPSLQKLLRETLGHKKQVKFGMSYDTESIHCEHGQQYDAVFRMKQDRPFFRFKGRTYLRTPLGAQICSQYLNQIKIKYPEEEQLHPKLTAFKTIPQMKRDRKKVTRKIIMREIMSKPITRFYDPTHRVPWRQLAKHLWRYGIHFFNDERFVPNIMKKVHKDHPKAKVIVLGHSHLMYVQEKPGRSAYITDTWRNEIDVHKDYEPKKKTYVEIQVFESGAVLGEMKKYD